MKSMLLGASVALALATSAFADVTTSGSFSGSSTEFGTTNTYTTDPVAAYRLYTAVQGSSVTNGSGQITFSDGAIAASTGSSSSPTSAMSTTTISQLVTNTTGAAKDVTFSSILSGGSFGLFASTLCEGSKVGCNSYLDQGYDLAGSGTATSGFNVDVLVNGVSAYSLSGQLSLVNGVLTPEITQAKNFLNDFTSTEVDNRAGVLQQFYNWNDTDLSVNLGDLAAGSSFDVSYDLTTYTTSAVDIPEFNQGLSQIGYSAFGDPTGGGHTINNINIRTFVVNTPEILFAPISSGTPEPSVWTMMIVGIGLAGASLRSRRSGVVAA